MNTGVMIALMVVFIGAFVAIAGSKKKKDDDNDK